MKYILNALGEPEQCDDIMDWAMWFETASRRVALTKLDEPHTDVTYIVSTVFLGLNYNHFSGPPILWETMVFKGDKGMWFDRCGGSREQAEAMHDNMCRKITERTTYLLSKA
jgi:hypothetical protein